MEVDKVNFPTQFLCILEAIADAHLVAIDLELSGVPVRSLDGTQRRGEQTLQERYLETKAAAEIYQILQIGLTCVSEDLEAGEYVLRPYNVNLSPVIVERIDIDRQFSFHSGAVEFLLGVDFNFHTPLQWGVHYLSRDEATLALKRAKDRSDRDRDDYTDMQIKDDDVRAQRLIALTRQSILAWSSEYEHASEQLFLGPQQLYEGDRAHMDDISRYDKRLVHQIVRNEFPQFLTATRKGGICILTSDDEREKAHKEKKLREVAQRVHAQTGFRWIMEAIAGSDLRNIDTKFFIPSTAPEDAAAAPDMQDLHSRLQRARALLEKRPTPLVGHNMFLDLVYIYRTFFGALPATVEGFQAAVHRLFPLTIDTKYLATCDEKSSDSRSASSLEQIAQRLDKQELPSIRVHEEHDKYEAREAFHEAGFDSLLTAKVAIRLSAKLEADERAVMDTQDVSRTGLARADSLDEDSGTGGVALSGTFGGMTIDPSPAEVVNESKPSWDVPDPDVAPQGQDLWSAEAVAKHWEPMRLMPRYDTKFWTTRGNRLRVFGTKEGVCPLI